MADSEIQALRAGPEILSGAAIPFRFEITWRSLTCSLEPTGTSALTRTSSPPAKRVSARDGEAKEWEMVLPRMKRRVQLSPAPEPSTPAQVAAPSFTLEGSSRGKRLAMIGTPVLLLAGIAAVYWSGQRSAPSDPVATEMGSAGWITEWASDPTGSARGRQISLYRPSGSMSDYRLEFLGRIEQKSLGWVFRASDSKNYYAGKLEYAGKTTASPLAITHFAVIKGVEGPHVQRVLAHAPGENLNVRLEARGSQFTVYLQNQIVEDWQDDRLKTGGVGFLNEREEQGRVTSIRISFPTGVR